MTRVYAGCSGSGSSSKNISGWWLKRSFGGHSASDADGVEVKCRARLWNAGVNKWEGKQRHSIGFLKTSVPQWHMSRATVGSYGGRKPVRFDTF